MRKLQLTLGLLLGLMLTAESAMAVNTTVSFENVPLGPEGYLNGDDLSGGFLVGETFFNNDYTDFFPGCCWQGWAISSATDTTTPGSVNQYSAFPGSGVGGSGTYAVAFSDFATITLPFATTVVGGSFTNTTYAALSMRDGDGFAKQFGGVTGTDPDFFNLSVHGYNNGGLVNSVVFALADYTGDTIDDYIIDAWTYVDLTSLGIVDELRFSFASSDFDEFGAKTPTYFALDNLEFVPEPSTGLMVSLGLVGLAGCRRRSTPR